MRGRKKDQLSMLSLAPPDEMVPERHPLRAVKKLADEALRELQPVFDEMYSSIPVLPGARQDEGMGAELQRSAPMQLRVLRPQPPSARCLGRRPDPPARRVGARRSACALRLAAPRRPGSVLPAPQG